MPSLCFTLSAPGRLCTGNVVSPFTKKGKESLRTVPFNITIVQAYATTSDYDDNEAEEFYDQLQNVIDQTPKKDILVVQGDWNAKLGRDACGYWQDFGGPFCNDDTNERGL